MTDKRYKHLSEETKSKIGIANSISLKNHKVTEETKRKISISLIGLKREPFSEEHKIKIGIAKKGKQKGESNPSWKGNEVSIGGFHKWIRKYKSKPELCEICNKRISTCVANIKNHRYSRNLEDYKWVCGKCHSKLDFPDGIRGLNLKKKTPLF